MQITWVSRETPQNWGPLGDGLEMQEKPGKDRVDGWYAILKFDEYVGDIKDYP